MLNLILAICSSAMVAIVMRFAQPRVSNPTGLLAGNYITCALVALVLSFPAGQIGSMQGIPFAIGLGAVNGLIYLGGFALMQWSTRHNGVVLSSIFMKLGILVSMLISIVWFRELPTVLQTIGFVLAVSAIVIINPCSFEQGIDFTDLSDAGDRSKGKVQEPSQGQWAGTPKRRRRSR